MVEYLFVYGSLKDPRIQLKIFGRSSRGAPDILTGYGLEQVEIGGSVYPMIKPDPFSTVTGSVFTLDENELKLVDDYQGPQYKRKKIQLRSNKLAWVYLK